MSFRFKAQLRAGQIGEVLFMYANADEVLKTDGMKGDFIYQPTGQTLELKTDFYSMEATPNFFIERYSDKDAKTPGGPWQSRAHGAELFVYFYIPSLTYFTFKTDELIGRLEPLIKNLAPFDVKNTSHVTRGYRVARDTVADLATVTQLEIKKK